LVAENQPSIHSVNHSKPLNIHVPSSVPVDASVLGVFPALQQSVFLYGSWSGIRGEAPPQTYPLTVGGRTEPCEERGTQVGGIGSKHGISMATTYL